MAVHHSPESLNRAIKARIDAKIDQAKDAIDDLQKETYDEAIRLTSGTTSQAQLNRENNPYGRGFTNPRGKRRGRRPALPINKDTGALQKGIKNIRRDARGRFSKTAEWRIEVHGVSYAQYVIRKKPKPGSKMIYRPFWDELDKFRRSRFDSVVRQQFRHRPRVA